MSQPTIVTIPCFSGAPWELDQLRPLHHRPMTTMRLPDDHDDIERYADSSKVRSRVSTSSSLSATASAQS
jgi:hypothetical protein